MTSAIVLTLVLLAPFAPTPQDPPKLEWKKGNGPELFADGMKAYEAKNYEEALKLFNKARKQVKGITSKKELGRWQTAARGGVYLQKLRKTAEVNIQQTYDQAEKLDDQHGFRDSPIGKEYSEFLMALRNKIFHVLEDFEHKGARYSEKHGKSFVKDSKVAQAGNGCLKWETVDNPSEFKIPTKRMPRNLTGYKAVSFWMNFPKGSGRPYKVMFMGVGKSQTGTGLTSNGYMTQKKPHKGWKRIRIPMSEFTKYGEVKWDQIKDFRIQFEGKRKMTVYLDDICLIRK